MSLLAHRWQRSGWEPSWEPFGVDRSGRKWTLVEIGSLLLSHVWTDMDARGRRLEIYGSGGWVFESPRARCERPGR